LADEDKNRAETEHSDNGADKGTHEGVCVLPPIGSITLPEAATAPTPNNVALAFRGEGSVGETNPSSPYAFDEPRLAPLYRMLHDIEQPEDVVVSISAENPRWAFEQRAYYRGTRKVKG
jgi:hypothetical protein